jgi:hypothetical protein
LLWLGEIRVSVGMAHPLQDLTAAMHRCWVDLSS